MKNIRLLLSIVVCFLYSTVASAYMNVNQSKTSMSNADKANSAGCSKPAKKAWLEINNVRAQVYSGGDMWWERQGGFARYEVPKGSGRHALYLGSLWISGREAQTNVLRVAAQRYGSSGVDFYTGPLDILGTAEIDAETCNLYDRIWSISRQDVEKFILCHCSTTPVTGNACDGYSIPQSILDWPGNPIVQANGQHQNMAPRLAPFYDAPEQGYPNGDGFYDPVNDCDYPYYDLYNNIDCKQSRDYYLYGDYTLWWVYNDKGNTHGESKGQPIGMEIQAQAFAFTTNDEINNMTFYNYRLINRSTNTLSQTYFAVNTDADLGGYNDDFVGCDVARGFGYTYNGNPVDNTVSSSLGYGANPPAIGIDFFQGPYLDSVSTLRYWDPNWNANTIPAHAKTAIQVLQDSTTSSIAFGINGVAFDDSIMNNERFGMRRFVYYNNTGVGNPSTTDPDLAQDYYNLSRGIWKDGSRMVFGADGYPSSAGATSIFSDFMFPRDSDPFHWGTKGIDPGFEWSEINKTAAGGRNNPFDRRFVQSAGPFTLRPGAENDITIGAVWARANDGDPFSSVLKVLAADLKAQALFDNCFRIINGPDAPDLNVQELDQKLVFYLTNSPTSNNYLNKYEELNYLLPEFFIEQTQQVVDSIVYYIPQFTVFYPTATDTVYAYTSEVFTPADTVFNIGVQTYYGYYTDEHSTRSVQYILEAKTDTSYNDRMIRFEGYLVYQLKDSTITATDIFGPEGSSKSRLVMQCDVKNFDENGNPIGKITNFEYDDELGHVVPKVKVNGENRGIIHSFEVTQDYFSQSKLVNNKAYYYLALAYGYNNYRTYVPDQQDGQKEPFFLGRRTNGNSNRVTAIPHIPASEYNGTVLNSQYGDMPEITRLEGFGNGGNFLDIIEEHEEQIVSTPPYKLDVITYKKNRGPVEIKVVDPLNVKKGTYILKVLANTTNSNRVVNRTATWVLLDKNSPIADDTVAISEVDISQPYEQIIYDRRDFTGVEGYEDYNPFMGISITLSQVYNFGPSWTISGANLIENRENNNGVLGFEIEYSNQTNNWLGFFPSIDNNTPSFWVRSGEKQDDNNFQFNSNGITVSVDNQNRVVFIDPQGYVNQNMNFFGGGSLVPYVLTSSTRLLDGTRRAHNLSVQGAVVSQAGKFATSFGTRMLNNLHSVEVVLTPDKSKWSRCPVFETHTVITPSGSSQESNLAYVDPQFPGNNKPFTMDLRYSPSVDKEGNPADVTQPGNNDPNSPNFINPWGMGWFPGYAIDVETGERLNIAFGEDSYLASYNGRDMIFNPYEANTSGENAIMDGWYNSFGDFFFAGKHYIYVFGSSAESSPNYAELRNYDHGEGIMRLMCNTTSTPWIPKNKFASGSVTKENRTVFQNIMWAGIPYHVKGTNWLESEVRMKLRVSRAYMKGFNNIDLSSSPQNDNNPMYEFTLDGLAAETNVLATAKSALDLIQVVPNPYYAMSDYEVDQLDNRVRVVNLPDNCEISIYALNGTLVRRLQKGTSARTFVDWDLKNHANIPIVSGLYIFHIKAEGIGERIIKWYGVIRPMDLNAF